MYRAGGLTAEGPSQFDPADAPVKRMTLERAHRRLLLIDRGKFGRTMLDLVGPRRI